MFYNSFIGGGYNKLGTDPNSRNNEKTLCDTKDAKQVIKDLHDDLDDDDDGSISTTGNIDAFVTKNCPLVICSDKEFRVSAFRNSQLTSF